MKKLLKTVESVLDQLDFPYGAGHLDAMLSESNDYADDVPKIEDIFQELKKAYNDATMDTTFSS